MIAERPQVAPVQFESEQVPRRLFYGPQEVADLMGSSRGFVYSLMDSGDLENLKLGGRRLIPASELDRLTRLAECDHD